MRRQVACVTIFNECALLGHSHPTHLPLMATLTPNLPHTATLTPYLPNMAGTPRARSSPQTTWAHSRTNACSGGARAPPPPNGNWPLRSLAFYGNWRPPPRLPFYARYANLRAVWLPPGWVWLDEAWDLDRATEATDERGWQYATNWATGWSAESGPMCFVRRRRWYRHRALAAKMEPSTAARLSEEAISRMSASDLRLALAAAGLTHADITSIDALRRRVAEARDSARRSRATAAGAPSPSGAAAEATPLMPPVRAGRIVQLKLPGSAWSAPVLLDAAGTWNRRVATA